jgi:glycerol-3-phosphate acyltransferase PlsY
VVLTVVRIGAPFIVAYLLGGVPWTLIVGKRFYGIDPRQHGSGNLGATNAYRLLGLRAAIIVLALDLAKGAVSVAVAMLFCPPSVTGEARDWALIGVAMAAILGHMYSPYIRFKGGKGVATAAGAIAVVMPLVWVPLLLSFVAAVYLSRMVSVGSIVVALEFPLFVWLFYRGHTAFMVFAFVGSALVLFRHRSNIVRIYRGEESKISWSGWGGPRRDSED